MSLVHFSETKMRHVAIKVAMVMPEIGFDELPMMPTMRDETVTKKKPKTTMRIAMNKEPGNVPGRFGRSAMMRTSAMAPTSTNESGRSRSVRLRVAAPAAPPRRSRIESRNDEMIVGSDLMSVMTPAQQTAP